jgi:hypothetical protein
MYLLIGPLVVGSVGIGYTMPHSEWGILFQLKSGTDKKDVPPTAV